MKCRSKKNMISAPAFSLVEVVTALIILALISSSVLVVINHCMASAVDSQMRMQAFEVARDNMETLLSKDSIEEMVVYGSSDKYPEIRWQNTIEVFNEPLMEQMEFWVRAICSAEYADSTGQVQTIELTQWLTALTKEQVIQMLKQEEQQRLFEPNEPYEPNEPFEPNEPQPDLNKPPPVSITDCDALPFCEAVMCHLNAGTPSRPTNEEWERYVNECP
jgi:hypothetical protein